MAVKELSILKKLFGIEKFGPQLTVFVQKGVILAGKGGFLPPGKHNEVVKLSKPLLFITLA